MIHKKMTTIQTKCLIIGGGPAGYTAAIYAVRAGLEPVLLEGLQPGGQLVTTTLVSNFPGFSGGIDANVLMGEMRAQAVNLGADIRNGVVKGIDLPSDGADGFFTVHLDDGKAICAASVIVATGASARYLGLPSEQEYKGRGVSACATCDGFFYRKKTVAVVGGGDTACEEATYLASLCKKVYMIVRRNELRATQAMQKRVFDTPNIEILWECNTDSVLGDGNGVTGARLLRRNAEVFDIDIDGFFLAIGHCPNTAFLGGLLELDAEGYIVTKGKSSQTSVPGIFAAGDVQDPHYRQAVVAAASGAKAAMDAKKWLDSKN